MALLNISPDKRYFTKPNGTSFFAFGANYLGHFDRTWQVWEKFDPTLITADFKKMAETGFNMVRLFSSVSLETELEAGDFTKLDRMVQMAANQGLLIVLVGNGSRALDLKRVTALDAKIADRYQDDPAFLGWDIEDGLSFFQLAASIYPGSEVIPLFNNELIQKYERRLSQQAALQQQLLGYLPAHLNPRQAYYYANVQIYFEELMAEAQAWSYTQQQSLVDFGQSEAGEKWTELIEDLNKILALWLAVRRGAMRRAGSTHLITTSHSNPLLAALPANGVLDFISFTAQGVPSLARWQETTQTLSALRRQFPQHPILMSELGYANQSSLHPATSQAVSEEKTALFELALWAYLRAGDYAGGLKWTLNDSKIVSNPLEGSYGLFRVGQHPKLAQKLLTQLGGLWQEANQAGEFKFCQDKQGLAFRLDLNEADKMKIIVGGGTYQDEDVSWQAQGVGVCLLELDETSLSLKALGDGDVTLNPWQVLPNWKRTHRAVVLRLGQERQFELANFPANETVSWAVEADQQYRLVLGVFDTDLVLSAEPDLIPNPGEHLLILGDANEALREALPYIREFGPDVSFTAEHVAGRWAYVTVVATPAQVPEAELDKIKGTGAIIVERIMGDVGAVLNDLVARKQRFVNPVALMPPGDTPVSLPPDVSPAERPTLDEDVYIVQAGDTLNKIAQALYQQGQKWQSLYEANRDMLDSPARLRPGLPLKIPREK
jgi:nucleoid-associated protein YgaU